MPSDGGGQRGLAGPTLGDGVALRWLRSLLCDKVGVAKDEAIEDLKNYDLALKLKQLQKGQIFRFKNSQDVTLMHSTLRC